MKNSTLFQHLDKSVRQKFWYCDFVIVKPEKCTKQFDHITDVFQFNSEYMTKNEAFTGVVAHPIESRYAAFFPGLTGYILHERIRLLTRKATVACGAEFPT